ncbi:fimbrial protein [Oleiagrimonas soli]|uniref:Type 1 fimbria pilin n=1 Tax=Oleiagrimonas soli TaxID=1543381 RepID=A0A841KRF5_9GAMM|nr:fimbrial protein [Oleiagrimonas soli]MBB6184568.1 type 1 fimbria pilin [Oleiagrimonas soli]
MQHALAPSRSSGRPVAAATWFVGLLLLALAWMPRAALADCAFTSGAATTVTFNAGTITLTPSTQVGSVLWTSNAASPANPPVLTCDGNTNGGIFNTIAPSTPVNGDNTLMPTGIPGVSYRLLHPDASTLLALYPYYPTGSGTFSVPTNLQLVYTGPYLPPDNSTLSGQLSQWKIDICDNPKLFFGSYWRCNGSVAPRTVETFNVNAIIHIQVPTCSIDPGSVSKSVALPMVNTQQLTSQGTTAANTPFSLLLTQCPNGLHVFITLDTTNPQSGATGVIAPTTGTGYATGVGVQILKADGTTPVTFGTAINTGTTAASSYNIDLYARYYQTGATVSSGNVKGVATYTINYQ